MSRNNFTRFPPVYPGNKLKLFWGIVPSLMFFLNLQILLDTKQSRSIVLGSLWLGKNFSALNINQILNQMFNPVLSKGCWYFGCQVSIPFLTCWCVPTFWVSLTDYIVVETINNKIVEQEKNLNSSIGLLICLIISSWGFFKVSSGSCWHLVDLRTT